MRAWAGDHDREFVHARLVEARRLLEDEQLANHPGVMVRRGDAVTEYRHWSETYNAPRNGLFDFDEPIMFQILDALPAGTVLDAACGTGRYAEHMATHGHEVIGVDRSPEMLSNARARVPQGTFALGTWISSRWPTHSVNVLIWGSCDAAVGG